MKVEEGRMRETGDLAGLKDLKPRQSSKVHKNYSTTWIPLYITDANTVA